MNYHKIYERNKFIILEGTSEYIVINKRKPFEFGHTHIKNYNTAIWLIKLVSHSTVPDHISDYLLESLLRISVDSQYISKLEKLKGSKKHINKCTRK